MKEEREKCDRAVECTYDDNSVENLNANLNVNASSS